MLVELMSDICGSVQLCSVGTGGEPPTQRSSPVHRVVGVQREVLKGLGDFDLRCAATRASLVISSQPRGPSDGASEGGGDRSCCDAPSKVPLGWRRRH